jgi:hypothetical protein
MFSEKLEVSAISEVIWSESLPDGHACESPLRSIAVEVGYPDFADPLGSDGKPALVFRAEGLPHVPGQETGEKQAQLMRWTRDNPSDIFLVSFLKLDSAVAGWNVEEVMIRKTVVFDSKDSRVELSGGGSTYVKETRTRNHAPVIAADEVGYVHVKFLLDRPLKSDAITMTLTCSIGSRRNIFTIKRGNSKDILWEIFSDKFVDATSFSYDLQIEVVGPNFDDEAIKWGTAAPIDVALPLGRFKYISPCIIPLPAVPPDKKDTIERFIAGAV